MGNGKTSLPDYEWHALTDADAQQHQQFVRAWSIHFNTPYYYSPTLSRNRSSSNFSAPGSFTPPTQLWKSHSVNRTRMTLKSELLYIQMNRTFIPRSETRLESAKNSAYYKFFLIANFRHHHRRRWPNYQIRLMAIPESLCLRRELGNLSHFEWGIQVKASAFQLC